MSTQWDITGDEIVSWSASVDAPHRLPELVRRLLLASAPVRSVELRADGGTRLGGWDGLVLSSGRNVFCPDGASAWELSVRGDIGKLNEDYDKRIAVPGSLPLSEVHYVAVSARRVSGKEAWEDERRRDGRWRDVRVLDADSLATWLVTAPAVARWFGSLLGRPSYHLLSLDEFLETWSQRTNPPFPSDLLVAGRRRERDARAVVEWAERGRGRLMIEADNYEDALLFAGAALANDAQGEAWRSRVVVAESRDALRWIMRASSAQPVLILPAYAEFDASHADANARVVVPAERRARPNALSLGDVPHRVIAKVLERCGVRAVESERLAAQSGGKLLALQRLFGFESALRWPSSIDRTDLATLLLVGAWTPDMAGDGGAVTLLGSEPSRLDALCEELSGPPTVSTIKDHDRWTRPSWRWISEGEAWTELASEIPGASLQRYAETATRVLGERDPKYDLPLDRRSAAALFGRILEHSKAIRAGVARSLARLAFADAALERRHGSRAGSTIAERVVRAVLQPPWIAWASIGGLLSFLAEAAPATFLDCVEQSIECGTDGVTRLFDEEDSFGGPHVPLLSALETLGWNPELLVRVARVLARLAEADVNGRAPGKVVNRPSRSLGNLFHPLMPATTATADLRVTAMRTVVREHPTPGFDLLLELLSTATGGVVFPGHRPQIAPWPLFTHDEQMARAERELPSNFAAVVDIALEAVGADASRWSRLLVAAYDLSDTLEQRVLESFRDRVDGIADPDALLWSALRKTLHRDTWYDESPPASAPLRRELYDLLTPRDPVMRVVWLFQSSAELPNRNPHDDWKAEVARLAAERESALEMLLSQPDPRSLIRRLSSRMKDGWILGEVFARAPFHASAESRLLTCVEAEPFPIETRATYIALRAGLGESSEWLQGALDALLVAGRLDDAFEVASRLASTERNWAVLDAVGEELPNRFWSKVERVFLQGLPDDVAVRAIDRLLENGNVATAVNAASTVVENIPPALILDCLQRLQGEQLIRIARGATRGYVLEQLLKHLGGKVDASALAFLEVRFLPLFEARRYRPKYFSAAMANEPQHFIELITAMYPDDSLPNDEPPNETAKLRAQAADHILRSWEGYPGDAESPEARDDLLYAWAKGALAGLIAKSRLDEGASELARILARAQAHDGHWPAVAVRRVLAESPPEARLSERLRMAKRNLRGMTSRAVGEGGRQERVLAERYRASAIALRSAWPATATMLERLADEYAFDAAEQDDGARAIRRRDGLDIPETSDELPSDRSQDAPLSSNEPNDDD